MNPFIHHDKEKVVVEKSHQHKHPHQPTGFVGLFAKFKGKLQGGNILAKPHYGRHQANRIHGHHHYSSRHQHV